MKHVHELQHNGLLWINVTKQTMKELGPLQERFHFLDADIEESLPPFQRPKITKRGHYYYIVLHFPVFDRESKRLGYTEVDFLLSSNYIITIHDNKLFNLEKFFIECSRDEALRVQYFQGTAVNLFFEILNRLLDAIFPILMHINEDINYVDKKLFTKISGHEMAGEILRLKTNIVTFRRTMQGHNIVLDRLMVAGNKDLRLPDYQTNINSLREYLEEIWVMLESQKESINALHEANESTLSLRTNDIMQRLTIISFITFPLSLFVTLFMVDSSTTPFIASPYRFWIVFSLTVLSGGLMWYWFKKRSWI